MFLIFKPRGSLGSLRKNLYALTFLILALIKRKRKKKTHFFSKSMASSWAELPEHLPSLIIPRLSMTDYVRFGCVCTWWNSIIKKREYRPKPESPWLILLAHHNDTNARFLSLSESRIYKIPRPSAQLPPPQLHRILLRVAGNRRHQVSDSPPQPHHPRPDQAPLHCQLTSYPRYLRLSWVHR